MFRVMDAAATAFHRAYENSAYDFEANGEARVLRVLAGHDTVRVFDVGANVGDWTLAARKALPEADIHSFEIAPATFAKLSRRVASVQPAITLNLVGLSAAVGRLRLNYVEQADFLSSGVAVVGPWAPQQIDVNVITGDLYCAERNIDRIDLLKIDVEGMEPQVLAGFARMLAARQIRVIQFEYGVINIAARFLLKDFYDQLTADGYRIGKIYPRCVKFREYDWRHEDFIGPNFLAVRATAHDLIRRLEGRSNPNQAG
jgi:FkbM family methyltransferase